MAILKAIGSNDLDQEIVATKTDTLFIGSYLVAGTTSGAVTLQTPAVVTDYSITLPAAQGGADTFLKNDGSGNMSWATAGGSFPTTSALTLSLVGTGATGTQISSTKASTVRVTCSTQLTYSLTGSVSSSVVMKVCSTNDSNEANWITVGSTAIRQVTGLAVTVGQTVGQDGQICGDVPAGWYVKLVNTGAGTHSEAFVSGQKTIY